MIGYARRALRDLEALRDHYVSALRPEALRGLVEALLSAEARIQKDPLIGLPAPRPYPELAKPGRLWIRSGRYWIAYRPAPKPVILAVFYDMANIPARL